MKHSRNVGNVSVSVVIPAFNEEQTVGWVVRRTCQVLEESGISFEVIVVDDGSDDYTALVCEKHGARVIKNGHRTGKGTALRTGFHSCRGDVIVTLDADGSHKPEEIPRLMAPIFNDGFDFTLGLRAFDLRGPLRVRLSHLGNLVFSFLISLFFGERVFDSQCGFRAFKSDVIREMNISSRRFEIESEMLINLLKKEYRFVEVPVTSKFTGSSNINVLGDGFLILRRILFCVAS
jgi:glycosyltransferase involved in cell wall biosynthesis